MNNVAAEQDPTRPIGNRPAPLSWTALSIGNVLKGNTGSYQLLRQLGSGSFGVVFQAQPLDQGGQPISKITVAVKIFHPPSMNDGGGLLKREVSSMLAMQTDRIPRVLDWFSGPDSGFMVLPYFCSGNLSDLMLLGGPMSESDAWRLLVHLLTALRAAHGASILHLDVKPANVLIDDNGGFVLVDFSIAQGNRVPEEILPSGLGSPGYRAPEQKRHGETNLDARTDLWSVGATVWSALTGILLNNRLELRTPTECGCGLSRLSDHRSGCSPEMEKILHTLLQVEPEKRPGSAAEVLAQIEAFGAGREIPGDALAAAGTMIENPEHIQAILDRMIDPLWQTILAQSPEFRRHVAYYPDGKVICRKGDRSFYTYILLQGAISIRRGGTEVGRETREGAIIGEVSTLTGQSRTADLVARGNVWIAVLNGAEFEELLTRYPSITLRLLKSLAHRLVQATEVKSSENGA